MHFPFSLVEGNSRSRVKGRLYPENERNHKGEPPGRLFLVVFSTMIFDCFRGCGLSVSLLLVYCPVLRLLACQPFGAVESVISPALKPESTSEIFVRCRHVDLGDLTSEWGAAPRLFFIAVPSETIFSCSNPADAAGGTYMRCTWRRASHRPRTQQKIPHVVPVLGVGYFTSISPRHHPHLRCLF